jgi:hypothetical protein
MRVGSHLYLLSINLRGHWRRYAAVATAMAVGAFVLGLTFGVGLGPGRSFRRHLDTLFPSCRVVLRPKALNVIWLQVETASITPDTVEAVRALPGVRRISPEATVRFPVSAEGSLAGQTYRTDISLTGVEPWALGEDAPETFAFDPKSQGDVPAVLSRYFLDLYNMTLAESNNLPKLSETAVVGRRFTLFLGESSLHAVDGPLRDGRGVRTMPCRIVGLSANPDLLGMALPLEAIEAFNADYGLRDKRYRALHVELESAQSVEAIEEQLPALGLLLHDRSASWRRVLVGVRAAGAGLAGLGALAFLLAVAYMLSAIGWMLSLRCREMALYQALGATPRQVLRLVGLEAALTSGVGVFVGIGVALGLLHLLDEAYRSWQAGRAFLPEDVFTVPWYGLFLAGGGFWLLAVMLVCGKILAETRASPGQSLVKGE